MIEKKFVDYQRGWIRGDKSDSKSAMDLSTSTLESIIRGQP